MTYLHIRLLVLELAVLLVIVVIPFSVSAGVFSVLFNTPTIGETSPVTYAYDTNVQVMPLLKAALNIDPNPAKGGGDIIVEDGTLFIGGDIGGKDAIINAKTSNGEISVYVVRDGDTLSQIASMFDVSAKTILWANNITDSSKIHPGDSLVILPITGVRHVVKKGDTLKSIAKKYEGDEGDIIAYNQLASADSIQVGDTIVIPNGTITAPPVPKNLAQSRTNGGTVASGGGSAGFTNPVPGSQRSQGIHGYNGVDLAAPSGTPVLSAAGGSVIVSRSSGWNGGYGLYVVVKHPNGTQTLYAHLSRSAVSVGDYVSQGQVVGYVGNTGRSTGNHLHFEVRGARNPF